MSNTDTPVSSKSAQSSLYTPRTVLPPKTDIAQIFSVLNTYRQTFSPDSTENNRIMPSDNEIAVNPVKGKVKLRKYIDEDPVLWFTLAEQSFAQFQVTEDGEKVAHIVRYLPNSIVLSVSDIINSQSLTKYSTLRDRVCTAFGRSTESKIDQVLSTRVFTGKPSQILNEMKRLVGDVSQAGEAIIRRIWISKLPRTVSRLLPLISPDKPLTEVAQTADTLWEEYESSVGATSTSNLGYANVQNYATTPFVPQPTVPNNSPFSAQVNATNINHDEITMLRREVTELKSTVSDLVKLVKTIHISPTADLNASHCHCNAVERSQSGSRTPRNRSPSPYPPRIRSQSPTHFCKFFDGKCFYHFRFGTDARSCREGCSMYDPTLRIVTDEKN